MDLNRSYLAKGVSSKTRGITLGSSLVSENLVNLDFSDLSNVDHSMTVSHEIKARLSCTCD